MSDAGAKCLQISAVAAGSINIIACGTIFGWSGPIVEKLITFDDSQGSNSSILSCNKAISKEQGVWIDSILYLGIAFGAIIPAFSARRIGSHFLLWATTFLFIMAWILVVTAKVLLQIYLGRFLLGVASAISLSVFPIYVAEISKPSIRGSLASLIQLSLAIGYLYAQLIGPKLSYQYFGLSCAAFHALSSVIFLHMPLSPYFLLENGLKFEAAKSLSRLSGIRDSEQIQLDLKVIQTSIDTNQRPRISRWPNWIFRKSVILTMTTMVLSEIMGHTFIGSAQVKEIFRLADVKSRVDPLIVLSFVRVLASAIVPFVIEMASRKFYLVISSVGCCLTTGTLAIFLYLNSTNHEHHLWQYTPVASLIFYVMFFCLGWGAVIWIILGEIFSEPTKFRGSAIAISTASIAYLILGRVFASLEAAFGLHANFFVYSFSSLLSLGFAISFLPETRERTLEEIQDDLEIEINNVRHLREESERRSMAMRFTGRTATTDDEKSTL